MNTPMPIFIRFGTIQILTNGITEIIGKRNIAYTLLSIVALKTYSPVSIDVSNTNPTIRYKNPLITS